MGETNSIELIKITEGFADAEIENFFGNLTFGAFKTVGAIIENAEAAYKNAAEKNNKIASCGVNPITGNPGIRDDAPVNGLRLGGIGNIRSGDQGAGGFHERTGGRHDGLDISAPLNSPIYANREGVISTSSWSGNTLIIKHSDNISTLYAHLSSYVVTSGKISQGQLIGYTGETGNAAGLPTTERHVHFGVFRGSGIPPRGDNRWIDPVAYLNGNCPSK